MRRYTEPQGSTQPARDVSVQSASERTAESQKCLDESSRTRGGGLDAQQPPVHVGAVDKDLRNRHAGDAGSMGQSYGFRNTVGRNRRADLMPGSRLQAVVPMD